MKTSRVNAPYAYGSFNRKYDAYKAYGRKREVKKNEKESGKKVVQDGIMADKADDDGGWGNAPTKNKN